MKNKARSSYADGVAVLTVSAIIVKLIGVCYKIPLVRLLGSQGMGYFNAAYDVYALLSIISTTGLPVAVSVMMNQYKGQQKRIFMLSLSVFLTLGALGACAVFFLADQIAVWVGAPGAAQSLRFIAPAVLFICLSGALRGYHQGQRNMVPTAISQVIEAACKLLLGLTFAYIAILNQQGPMTTAAFAVLGLSAGTMLSAVYLIFTKKENSQQASTGISYRVLLRQLLAVAFPVTLGAALSGLSKMIDLGLIMRRLQDIGFDADTAVSLYGCYSAMVIPFYSAVPALFGSVAMPLIPHLAHAIEANNVQKQRELLNSCFRLTALISIPGAIGMGMISDCVLRLLYKGSDGLEVAIPLLLILSISVPASCLITATNAILQAYMHPWLPMISMAIGCAVKAISLYCLAGVPSVGIMAAPISTLLCCTGIVLINLYAIGKHVPRFSFVTIWMRAIGISAISIGAASLIKRMLSARVQSNTLLIAVTVAAAVLLYMIFAYIFGLFRMSDIKPKKEKELSSYGNSRNDQEIVV